MSNPSAPKDKFGDNLKKHRGKLSPIGLKVADYIDKNRHGILGLSAHEIGLELDTSDATVIRSIQALGFAGLRDLKDTLKRWLNDSESAVQKMSRTSSALGRDSDAAIDFVISGQRAALEALGSDENRAEAAKAVDLVVGAEAVGIFGIAASGIIADYAARLFSRSGIPGRAYNRTGVTLPESLLEMKRGDVLIMLLHGRAHREATTALAEAKRLGNPVIMILGKHDAALRSQADACLVLPREKADKVALHSQTLFAIEALHLAVSTAAAERSVDTLNRLMVMRSEVRPFSR